MIVTLLTDFGTADYFVGAMKGVILSHDPNIRIVDLTHEIGRHDVAEAAYHLSAVYADFPPGTVHTVVVDPGVGSSRRAVVAGGAGQFFVGPDNGVFSYVADRHEMVFRSIDAMANAGVRPPGATFHGRDIFAPAAARLAAGVEFASVGPIVHDPVRLEPITNRRGREGSIIGRILHIDHFGNCVTSFSPNDLERDPAAFTFRIGDRVIDEAREFYSSGETGTPFMILGSAEFFEVAVNQGSAAAVLGVSCGTPIVALPRDT